MGSRVMANNSVAARAAKALLSACVAVAAERHGGYSRLGQGAPPDRQ